jgi:hypothetical protein
MPVIIDSMSTREKNSPGRLNCHEIQYESMYILTICKIIPKLVFTVYSEES